MKRAYSVDNVLNAKFHTLPFEGKWKEALGCPELSGSWFIYGDIKTGKTSFTMQLTKYITEFERVTYYSFEEGLSQSIQEVYRRENMKEASGKFILLNKEPIEDIIIRLKKPKSTNVIVIDTVQYASLKIEDYKQLIEMFPKKLFIYVSHVDGRRPEGRVARKIHQYSNLAIRVEGFKAFPVGRYGGGTPIVVNETLANTYWGLQTA